MSQVMVSFTFESAITTDELLRIKGRRRDICIHVSTYNFLLHIMEINRNS